MTHEMYESAYACNTSKYILYAPISSAFKHVPSVPRRLYIYFVFQCLPLPLPVLPHLMATILMTMGTRAVRTARATTGSRPAIMPYRKLSGSGRVSLHGGWCIQQDRLKKAGRLKRDDGTLHTRYITDAVLCCSDGSCLSAGYFHALQFKSTTESVKKTTSQHGHSNTACGRTFCPPQAMVAVLSVSWP